MKSRLVIYCNTISKIETISPTTEAFLPGTGINYNQRRMRGITQISIEYPFHELHALHDSLHTFSLFITPCTL